jgi:hypothetical protein
MMSHSIRKIPLPGRRTAPSFPDRAALGNQAPRPSVKLWHVRFDLPLEATGETQHRRLMKIHPPKGRSGKELANRLAW